MKTTTVPIADFSVEVREWPWLVATSALACALALVYAWWQHPRYGRNTGPALLPILGCLPQIVMNANRIYDWSTEQMQSTPTQTWRAMCPVNFHWIETANPANVEHILKTNFNNYPKGKLLPGTFFDLLGFGIFNADGAVWKLQRRAAGPVFATRAIRDLAFTSAQRNLTERLIPILDSTTSEINLQELLLNFTFDSICHLAFGADPRCFPSLPFQQAFDDAVNLVMQRTIGTTPHWPLLKRLNLGSERKLRHSLSIIDSFAYRIIQARRTEIANHRHNLPDDHTDLLTRFMQVADNLVATPELQHQIAADPRSRSVPPSDLFLRDIILNFILAGRDTSACALSWFFYLLSQHPSAEARIITEIGDKDPTYDDLQHMNYLQAALAESMRLFPPVPLDAKQAVEDDVLPDGTVVEAGLVVAYNVYSMGRNERIWGRDFREFRPERFLGADGAFVWPSLFRFPVFQAGPRICLGMDLGMVQMKLVVACLLRRFEVRVREGYCARYGWSMTMKIVGGLPVRVRRRERSEAS